MRKNLITGLALLAPFLVCLYFIRVLVNLAAIPFSGVAKHLLSYDILTHFFEDNHHEFIQVIFSKILAIIFLMAISTFIGFLTHTAINKFLIEQPINLITKLPLIGWMMAITFKIGQRFIQSTDKSIFSKSVILSFFNPKHKVIGLVSNVPPPSFIDEKEELNKVVFVPTAPHPVCGFLVLTNEKNLQEINIDPAHAFAYVISCGTSETEVK